MPLSPAVSLLHPPSVFFVACSILCTLPSTFYSFFPYHFYSILQTAAVHGEWRAALLAQHYSFSRYLRFQAEISPFEKGRASRYQALQAKRMPRKMPDGVGPPLPISLSSCVAFMLFHKMLLFPQTKTDTKTDACTPQQMSSKVPSCLLTP